METEDYNDVEGLGASPSESKPDAIKRFLAYLIDGLIALVFSLVIPGVGWIISAAYWLFRDGMEFGFMNKRSIGKQLMKLRPVTLDGSNVDIMVSAKRNWPFALGAVGAIGGPAMFIGLLGLVEAVMVLANKDGRRIGDQVANTMVIESEL